MSEWNFTYHSYTDDIHDAAEYAARRAAGIPKNVFDDIFGPETSRVADELFERMKGRKSNNSYWMPEEAVPEPRQVEEKFIEVRISASSPVSMQRIYDFILINKRPEVELYYVIDGYRLVKKLFASEPDKIVERVLTKDEVTVTTPDAISDQ